MMGSWGLISDVDHKALWGFPTKSLCVPIPCLLHMSLLWFSARRSIGASISALFLGEGWLTVPLFAST